jgi:lipoprotein-releasing system ATP-binding protein
MLIEIKDIRKSYGVPGTPSERKVLEGITLGIAAGETVAITGPSGSGKTTLLNLMAALDRPDSGSILFGGTSLAALSGAELDSFRSRSIGLVFQLHHLLPQCTLLENVLLPVLALHRRAPSALVERAGSLIRRMGIWEVRNQKPGELSGGECQRAAVARALINDPQVLLADEPTGALDQKNAVNLVDLLTEINRTDGKTIVMVTHSAELAGSMNRTLQLHEGIIS